FEPHIPVVPTALRDVESVIREIGKRDLLLHHPYESFDPVVRFLSEAADDPNVLAIKQTLYRTSGDSPFVRALARAAENGKQVTVLVEIKARFDEANNIAWARRLEESGVHVVYGLIGLKTHAKVALVVRREGDVIRRYVHLGTGNYNSQTARLYTDLSLFTAREEIADDASALFNMLTGFADPPRWRRLVVAPFDLESGILERIEREASAARQGQPARIIAKMNSLSDPAIIRALYAASQAGVEIDLVVRGICCLRPGIPGVSDRIRVTSVVDRFLEHSRVFAFGVGDRTEVLLSSADWMTRNFQRRIEAAVPIDDPALRARVLDEVLGFALRDNVKARQLQNDGTLAAIAAPGGEPAAPFQSQLQLCDAARRSAEQRAPDLRPAAPPEPVPTLEPRAGSAA
ncbi:MAG TPA: polyphosphate kinase 1, partial [Kofleriaceae bacterium]|nr:polyphosphate kinase 1 [Kofleriaceae bacterium]